MSQQPFVPHRKTPSKIAQATIPPALGQAKELGGSVEIQGDPDHITPKRWSLCCLWKVGNRDDAPERDLPELLPVASPKTSAGIEPFHL